MSGTVTDRILSPPHSRQAGQYHKGLIIMMRYALAVTAASLLTMVVCAGAAEVHEVASPDDLSGAMEAAEPGDEIVLADGEWLDADLNITCSGAPDAPITIRPQTPGGLTLTGISWVRLSGSHLVLSGLRMYGGAREVAGDGVEREQRFAPIDIRGDHNRVTECAIIDFNPVGREHRYMWVVIRGVGNQVDRCYFRGQDHSGVTMTVNVDPERPNEALIYRNYFAGRPPLGANGGETIRIGTSHVSMSNSHTTVQENLFEHCDGEIEIISNKSCENRYVGNTFRESAGELTLRHGDRCVVEGNYFFCNGYERSRGNGYERARGIRIIGRDHRVVNNYIYEPALYGIVFQEGIVDTPLAGYFQVERALVAFNTIVASSGTPVWMGRSAEFREDRPLHPIDSTFVGNIFLAPDRPVFARAQFPDNFDWENNFAWGDELGIEHRDGITWTDPMLVEDEHGLLRPADGSPAADAGFEGAEPVAWRPLTAADVGPSWMD